MIPAIPFYMIRHGESVANLGQFASGHVDVALTDTGIAQAYVAQKIVDALEVKPSIIIHSHLQRARNTAKILNENLKLPMMEDALIAEQHYGDWEGQPWELTRQPTRDGIDPPNGERHVDFHERVRGAITRFVEKHPGPVMIVCHGGVFRAFGAIYKSQMHGVENCMLHHFEPHADNQAFPWNIRKF
jgi:broad specificity phosphatase PhoE